MKILARKGIEGTEKCREHTHTRLHIENAID